MSNKNILLNNKIIFDQFYTLNKINILLYDNKIFTNHDIQKINKYMYDNINKDEDRCAEIGNKLKQYPKNLFI